MALCPFANDILLILLIGKVALIDALSALDQQHSLVGRCCIRNRICPVVTNKDLTSRTARVEPKSR